MSLIRLSTPLGAMMLLLSCSLACAQAGPTLPPEQSAPVQNNQMDYPLPAAAASPNLDSKNLQPLNDAPAVNTQELSGFASNSFGTAGAALSNSLGGPAGAIVNAIGNFATGWNAADLYQNGSPYKAALGVASSALGSIAAKATGLGVAAEMGVGGAALGTGGTALVAAGVGAVTYWSIQSMTSSLVSAYQSGPAVLESLNRSIVTSVMEQNPFPDMR